MARKKHDIYTGHTTGGLVILKCRCGFEVKAHTEAEARKAHAEAIKVAS
jgi:hypothetical protein